MELTEYRYATLLVSASQSFVKTLQALLPTSVYDPISVRCDAASARRALLENRFDIVIVNTPLPDEFGTALALDACADSGAGVLLLVRAELFPQVNEQASPGGVLTLPKPLSQTLVSQSLTLLRGTRERLRRMEQKTATLEEKMQEIRLVNHAKWVLIEQLKMTEEQAHKYIEKQAMDRCITRRAVAENILSTYC
jgi:AmiR/NasT family two-component response regulator